MDDAYAAGLFDGEGYVRIAKWKKPKSEHIRYTLHVGIGVTFYPAIEVLHEKYGGSIHMNRHDLRNPRNRIQFSVVWGAASAAVFLRRIHPHSIIKREQIEIALELQDHIKSNRYVSPGRNHMLERDNREEILAYRHGLYERISALKKEAFPPLTA